ncbi:MAG: PAS domain S-box protein [SAR324 cluster bacterium]|uniref:histidine kinase n=1 Tax=SAR324 cluster bacterium TaxID=2024889 RepID=A0A7X9FRI3_9DELT|nr:PAS domain S-box protein [SAR324 cluster bacterium]
MRNTSSLQEALAGVCAFIGSSFGCDCVHIFYYHSNELIHRHWGALKVKSKNEVRLFSIKENSLNFKDAPINTPVFISDLNRIAPRTELVELLQKEGNHSFALIPIVFASELVGWIECYDRRQAHVWRREEQTLLTVLSVRVPIILRERPQILEDLEQGIQETSGQEIEVPSPGEVYYEKLSEVQQEYKRLLEYGNFVLLRTNPDFAIIDVQGDTERILGLTASEMLNDADIWARILSTKTRLLFVQKIREVKKTSSELNDELKFIHVKTGQERWILFRGVPLFSSSKELIGWEAIALDITEKKQAEESLVQEKRRLQALYEVAHASQSTAEPEIIALRILRTLRHATHSPVGFVALLNSTTSLFELVAAEGFVEQEVY